MRSGRAAGTMPVLLPVLGCLVLALLPGGCAMPTERAMMAEYPVHGRGEVPQQHEPGPAESRVNVPPRRAPSTQPTPEPPSGPVFEVPWRTHITSSPTGAEVYLLEDSKAVRWLGKTPLDVTIWTDKIVGRPGELGRRTLTCHLPVMRARDGFYCGFLIRHKETRSERYAVWTEGVPGGSPSGPTDDLQQGRYIVLKEGAFASIEQVPASYGKGCPSPRVSEISVDLAADPNPLVRGAFENVKSVHLKDKHVYRTGFDGSSYDRSVAYAGLPIRRDIGAVLQCFELQLGEKEEACDAIISVSVKGTSVLAQYVQYGNKDGERAVVDGQSCYSGADVDIRVSFLTRGANCGQLLLSGSEEPPSFATWKREKFRHAEDAPFSGAYSKAGFIRELFVSLYRLRGGKDVAPLVRGIADDSLSVHAMAALKLCDPNWAKTVGARKAIPVLVRALKGEEAYFVMETLEAIDRDWAKSEEAKEGVPELITGLSSGSYKAYERTAEILGQIGDPRAIEPLIRSLNPATRASKEDTRYFAGGEALGKLTGQAYSTDYDAWMQWWEVNKEKFLERK